MNYLKNEVKMLDCAPLLLNTGITDIQSKSHDITTVQPCWGTTSFLRPRLSLFRRRHASVLQ